MSKLFSISKEANPNYLASIQRIESLEPIEGADRLVKTIIGGYDMVISKDMKVGDIVIYFPIESSLSEKFLSVNNLYERKEFEKNSNAEEIKSLILKAEEETNEMKKAEILADIKSQCGFFGGAGRVRILKLRGVYSQGFICGMDALEKTYPELIKNHFIPAQHIGETFDTVCGDKIIWKYVPPAKNKGHQPGNRSLWKKRMKNLKKFDRIIPGTFAFHYDTARLEGEIRNLSPEDIVTMTVKVHGTSAIFANIPVNRKLSILEKIKKLLHMKVQEIEYGNVYSSRSIIKNQYINKGVSEGYYGADVWGYVERDIAPYIDKGMTIYGEICGYIEGSRTMIQKNHDYGCGVGQWKFMPYRITTLNEDGSKREWNVTEVMDWTESLRESHPELKDKLMTMILLYHGPLKDLYPQLDVQSHWHENLLEMLKTDARKDSSGHRGFGMELREPLCKNKVPREGIVIRIDDDKYSRAWKLKTNAHFNIEAMQHDAGESDMEEES